MTDIPAEINTALAERAEREAQMLSELPPGMLRYCVHCREMLDYKRTVRGSFYCANEECRKEEKKARRAFKASRACRLCGRPARKPKPVRPAGVPSPSAPGAQAEDGLFERASG